MEFSIIIATCGRIDSLRRLLENIQIHFCGRGIEHEVIVANNAINDVIERKINDLVIGLNSARGTAIRIVRERVVGKCRAQNTAIRSARGRVLAFFDDDVDVTPEWLPATVEFFRREPYDVMQGPILIPPEMQANENFLKAQWRFRTIHFLQYPPQLKEINTLNGANMAVRREIFAKVGCFNEELGPGKSGMSEDVEFARRVIRNGGRIGYEPRAGVYHRVDWNRLTEQYFRQKHEQQGRSRLLLKKRSVASIVPNMLRSIWMFGWYSALGNERRKYRAKGRYFHYRAMLEEKTKRITKNRDGSLAKVITSSEVAGMRTRHEAHEHTD